VSAIIGEYGTRLSGGQRQRIAIARALYRDPNVLVFDEATSALDNVTEQEITNAIENLSGEKTILIVAHRLSTVSKCNKIIFMKEGHIVSSGSYDELLANSDDFRKLAKLGNLAGKEKCTRLVINSP
jgi:ABC-type multidrug transport system fused ATPase/permease subunit